MDTFLLARFFAEQEDRMNLPEDDDIDYRHFTLEPERNLFTARVNDSGTLGAKPELSARQSAPLDEDGGVETTNLTNAELATATIQNKHVSRSDPSESGKRKSPDNEPGTKDRPKKKLKHHAPGRSSEYGDGLPAPNRSPASDGELEPPVQTVVQGFEAGKPDGPRPGSIPVTEAPADKVSNQATSNNSGGAATRPKKYSALSAHQPYRMPASTGWIRAGAPRQLPTVSEGAVARSSSPIECTPAKLATKPVAPEPAQHDIAAHDVQHPGRPEKPNEKAQTAANSKTPAARQREPDMDCSNITTPGNTNPPKAVPRPLSPPPSPKPLSFLKNAADTKKYLADRARLEARGKSKPVKKPKKLPPMTPAEFAEHANSLHSDEQYEKMSAKYGYLRGMKIFYISTYMVVAPVGMRNDMLRVAERGGRLVPTYDPTQITVIIAERMSVPQFLAKTGLKSLAEVPLHIPIVTWKWFLSGQRYVGLGPWHQYASFHERVTFEPHISEQDRKAFLEEQEVLRNPPPVKKREPVRRTPAEDSNDSRSEEEDISSFTPDRPVRYANAQAGPSKSKITGAGTGRAARSPSIVPSCVPEVFPARTSNDPLAEFYDIARAERDAESKVGQAPSDDPASQTSSAVKGKGKEVVFQCDRIPGAIPKECPNQFIIDPLTTLMKRAQLRPEKTNNFKVFGYRKAINSIKQLPKRLEDEDEARNLLRKLPGIGEKTLDKILEIIRTGTLRRLTQEVTTDIDCVKIFHGIYGVGQSTAYQWYMNGCRTLDDVRQGKGGIKLSTPQKIGLKYYDDINTRMPREEAQAIFNLIKPIAKRLDPRIFIEIMGSFRRGKADCGDIDILITRPTDDGKTHAKILPRLLDELHGRGIVTEDLSVPDDWSDLELVYRGLCRKDSKSPRRRIDFLAVPYSSRGAALLYYTGDDIFNRSMRMKANKMGYSLNQKGLYADVIRNPSNRREKLHTGRIIASKTELEIFEKLGVPWQEPHQRVRG